MVTFTLHINQKSTITNLLLLIKILRYEKRVNNVDFCGHI